MIFFSSKGREIFDILLISKDSFASCAQNMSFRCSVRHLEIRPDKNRTKKTQPVTKHTKNCCVEILYDDYTSYLFSRVQKKHISLVFIFANGRFGKISRFSAT